MSDGTGMDLRQEMSVGDRLKIAREYVDITQEQLAERAGINVDTVRKLEQGQRQSARISTVNALAEALGIDTTALLLGVPDEEERENTQLAAIRRALVPADDFLPPVDDSGEDTPPDLEALRRSIGDAWTAYHGGDFTTLDVTVPRLLDEARIAAREQTNGTVATAQAMVAKVSQLGAHVLVQNRMEDYGLLGLDRAQAAARSTDSPLMSAMVNNSVSWIFLRTGRLADSERVAVTTADEIEPGFRSSPPEHVAVYGGLLLSAMTAAARAEQYGMARELLKVARAAAERLEDDSTDRWTTVFGPTSVAMQAVSVEAAAGEWGTALTLARRVPMTAEIPDSWKVRFLLDVAHAQTETYRDAEAVETLRSLRQMAPGWLRRHGLAKAVVRDLLARPKRPRGVVALAKFLGIAH
jgi:transcriptional regulator with XRE-family HTH domain